MSADQEITASISYLLEGAGERRARMLRVADFATFFGNVLPTNPDACIKKTIATTARRIRPLLALRPVQVPGGSLAMVEFDVQSRVTGRSARQTDLMFYDDRREQPGSVWETEGLALASLVPRTTDNATQHNLETLHGVPLTEISALHHITNLTNMVLETRGLTPYPGYQGTDI